MNSLASLLLQRLTAALALFAGLGLAGAVSAADDALRAVPDKITLGSGLQKQKVKIVLAVPATTTVSNARLSHLDVDGLIVDQSPDPVSSQTSDISWTVEVRAKPNAAKEAIIVFAVDYESKGSNLPAEHASVATAAVTVTYDDLTLSKALKVGVEHGFESLTSGIPKKAFLVIENTGAEDITFVPPILVVSPAFVAVSTCFKDAKENPPDCNLPKTIYGRTTLRLPIEFEAKESVSPGTVPTLLNLSFSHRSAGGREIATIGVVDPLQLGIPGLSDIKTVMQLPSLLALPGVLMGLTWVLIWRLRHQGSGQPEFWLPPDKGPFYVVAITLSIVIAYAYSRLVLHEVSGLLESVSLRDIANIWFGSIALGMASYFVTACCGAFYRNLRQHYIDKYHPKTGEVAEVILGKLTLNRMRPANAIFGTLTQVANAVLGKRAPDCTHKWQLRALNRIDLQLPSYLVGQAGHEQRVFRLDFGAADAAHCWIIPRIVIRIVDPHAHAELGGNITDAINANDIRALQIALKGQTNNCNISWDKQDPYDGPTNIDVAQLTQPLGRQAVLECT